MATDKQVLENTYKRIGYKIAHKEQLDEFETTLFVLTALAYCLGFCKWLQQWKRTN